MNQTNSVFGQTFALSIKLIILLLCSNTFSCNFFIDSSVIDNFNRSLFSLKFNSTLTHSTTRLFFFFTSNSVFDLSILPYLSKYIFVIRRYFQLSVIQTSL